MNPNPYAPPDPYGPPGRPPSAPSSTLNRTPFILAAVGAGLASAYWAALTLLIGLGAALGRGSLVNVFVPCVLIALYAVRGYQIYKGDGSAARRILWLHGVGGIVALMQMASGGTILFVLQGIKILIHVFGGVTAYLAWRAFAQQVVSRV
jgi:hypothetical protein